MTRSDWLNLNGEWQLRQSATDDAPAFGTDAARAGQRAVPGRGAAVRGQRAAGDNRNYLFYRRTFTVPDELARTPGAAPLRRGRLADHRLGQRRAGRRPHRRLRRASPSTSPRAATAARNEIVVEVWDPTDSRQNGSQPPIGKQTRQPGGIFYTPGSGIWQTVWLEPVPPASISSVDLYSEPGRQHPRASGSSPGATSAATRVLAEALDGTHRGRHRHRRVHRVHACPCRTPAAGRPTTRSSTTCGSPCVTPQAVRSTGPRTTSACARSARGHGQRRAAAQAQRPVRLPDRHARPGLLARRALHRADRRRARVRPAEAQGPRLQHGAQAHQGRAAALVLPAPTGSACWSGRTCRR